MSPARFRVLLAVATAAHLWWLSIPTAAARGTAHSVHYALLLAAAVGLFLLQSWGRVCLLLALLLGLAVARPLDAVIGSASLILAGIVLGVAFSPPISGRLVRRGWEALDEEQEPPPDETLFVPIVQGDPALIDVTASWLEASNIEYVVEGGRLLVRAEHVETARSIVAEASGEMRPN